VRVSFVGYEANEGLSLIEALMRHESCVGCDYLSICYDGCPVRTYTITGGCFVKDPYCQVYKALFSTMEELAAKLAASGIGALCRCCKFTDTHGGRSPLH
jgi:hypothetical protein